MPSITASFTAPGISSTLISIAHGDSSFTLTGDFIGTAVVERSITTSGLAWEVVAGPLYAAGSVGFTSEDGGRYRLRCLTYTSGTANCTLSLADTPPIIFDFDFNHLTSVSGALNGSIGATTPNSGAFTTLNSTGGVLNGTIGAVTPATGAFTSVAARSGIFTSTLAASAVPALWTGGNINTAAGAFQPAFNSQIGFISGTMPSGTNLLNIVQTQSDTSVATTGENVNLGVYYSFGGTAFTGSRANMRVVTTYSGNSTNPVAHPYHRGLAVTTYASGNDGGTMLSPNANWFGIINDVGLSSGALYWNSVCGQEIDVSVATGASADRLFGLLIVQKDTHAVAATNLNIGLGFANQSYVAQPGWTTGISFGSLNGTWPINSAGTIIGTSPTGFTPPVYAAAYGVDFSAVAFSAAFLKSTGFLVDGTGITTVAQLTSATNNAIRLTGQTSGAAAALGTLTNAPAAGDPAFWLPVTINGTTRYIPAW